MLHDWTGVDQEKAVSYIKSCKSYDGAIALLPGQEGHGGSTFCGVASLVLMGRLDEMEKDFTKDLVQWCVSRQVNGMQGRPNKAEDTCYSYWIGGTLRLLGHQELLDEGKLCHYVMTCQTQMGGFGKVVGAFPDVLHSFYSMAWLSLSTQENELKALNCTLGICQERAAFFEGNVP
jgi:geranylgeranyl transferase type-1 subunit beta